MTALHNDPMARHDIRSPGGGGLLANITALDGECRLLLWAPLSDDGGSTIDIPGRLSYQ